MFIFSIFIWPLPTILAGLPLPFTLTICIKCQFYLFYRTEGGQQREKRARALRLI